MKLAFVKMHGIGNDFVLIDNMLQKLELDADQVRLLADRRRGIGCDQLLMVEPPQGPGADVRARIFNSSGWVIFAWIRWTAGRGRRCSIAR